MNQKNRLSKTDRREIRRTKILKQDPIRVWHLRNMKEHQEILLKKKKMAYGFTLIEVLVVIGIIAVLATIVLVTVNPARQFKLARDSQRTSNVNALLNAIHQNMAEHRGTFTCSGTIKVFTSSSTRIRDSVASSSAGDIASCIVPDYIASVPFDPSRTNAHYTSSTDYDSGYDMSQDPDGRITIVAQGELTTPISVTR
jgi:type IV pilus assembly protein PilA